MHSSTETIPLSAVHQYQSAKFNSASSSNASYAFLSNPPKHKHKPHPISTRCSPPRSLSRAISSRRRSSISGSPAFQASFIAITPTPTSDIPKTPLLTSHGYTASFASFPRRGSVPHVQEAQIHLARRAPVSPKRGHSSGSPKRSHHRSPSSPFAPPSPTRTRPRAKSTTRMTQPLPPTPPLPHTSKLSKIRSLTNLRARSPSPAPPLRTPIQPTMTTPANTTLNVSSKHAKRSATPARGSAAFTKYRPMPFIQQMQMIQFLEGGTLDSHIRKHHVHAGQGTAHTGFATGGKEDIAHGYSFTDERGMIWFDEEEEWEFTSLLPRTRPQQRRRGIKRLLGKRRDEQSGDEWEDFVEEEEERDEDVDPEVLLAREDDALRVREDDLVLFGGALEGPWAKGRSGSSVLKLPKPKIDRKSKRAACIIPSAPLPESVPTTARCPREQVVALKEEFLATAFTPPPARTSSSSAQPSRATKPFRIFRRTTTFTDDSASRTLFQRHQRATTRPVPYANAAAGGQTFANMGGSLRGGDVLDATETATVPLSPTVEWANVKNELLPPASSLIPVTETPRRTPSPIPTPESRLTSVSPPPAAARRLGIEPSTAVSLQPSFADTIKKSTFRSLRGLKSAKGN